ncbi:MAG: endonuclease III [Acidobacteria bacterium]|nr:endonuclease III [Acidobacteriota bacterium]
MKSAVKPKRTVESKLVAARPAGKKAAQSTDPKRVAEILKRLKKAYPDAKCALTHSNPFQLLVATILSAQCTDERVNKTTPELFRKYPTPRDLAAVRQEVLEVDIRSTGFYRNKAKNIIGASQRIVKEYSGKVPQTMEELLTLPGVARKTANVVLGNAFAKAVGVVVDTHVHRISQRLDLTKQDTPEKIEQDLMKIIPQDRWINFSHEIIFHGRRCCIARKPKCADCPLEDVCSSKDKTN